MFEEKGFLAFLYLGLKFHWNKFEFQSPSKPFIVCPAKWRGLRDFIKIWKMRQILGTFNRVDILCHEQLLDHLLILLFHFQDKTASYHPFALKGDKTALQMCLQYKLESSFI